MAGRGVAPAVTGVARSLSFREAQVVVVASPHGAATGVYAAPCGDLDAFGPRGIDAAAATDPSFVHALAERWGFPVLDAPADHGIVVPLRLLGTGSTPVVAVTFEEGLGTGEAVAEAESLAAALTGASETIAFVASANTSAGLTERAPLPSLPGAAAADDALLDALSTDPRLVPACLPALARAGSCAAGPLAALAIVLGTRPCDVLAYEHPAGVGYLVAVAR
ncbi:MAG: hypothetical protein M3323_00105 [Actinomycetota bacterium]|nr:hypothetical protein [Actinomycetota bacterium]